ncbi:23S rRNA (uracil(1939)-C(5))-methyltransferase RlmD [Mesoaciditoga lauensis]|uniref:23S rRNA (uracil(1939)-C(5))-methyltransferase RlmD n=1 Tax=Mesoaciditoga lauensis TaxID=1495039 RepID=UPI000565C0C7|nr:23S rRNA (uracil(1939)-C(5))-methyltransferase RlmD [Mesoaciditoga lauensis]
MKLKIEKIVYGGYGLAHTNGTTYFVRGAYPGEEVNVKILKQKKDLCFAQAEKIVTPSPFRIQPSCKHFEKCGGCEWMDVSYEQQLEFKREIFKEQMKRIAKYKIKDIFISQTNKKHYRNKVEFVVHNSKLGFFKRKSHEFVEIDECEILSEKINEAKRKVENVLKSHPNFSSKVDHVIIKEGENGIMVIFTSTRDITPPYLDGVESVVTLKRKATSHVIVSGKERVCQGTTLEKTINGIRYRIPAKSFFQVNDEGAKLLAELVKNYAGYGENVLDLYCGVGFFSLQLHDNFKRVFGVESSPPSIRVAKENAKLNGFDNIQFQVKRIENWQSSKKFDVIVVDPPRSGLGKSVEKISTITDKVVYVSCDSSTFARDTAAFMKKGFEIKKVKLIDMFPQTHHFETIALFERM